MAKAALEYASCTTTVKFISFFKEAIIAASFGISGDMDAYLIAFMLIGFPLGILLVPIQTAFIPLYLAAIEKSGQQEALKLFKTVISITFLIMSFTIIFWMFLSPYIINMIVRGSDYLFLQSVERLFLLLVPYYFLNGLNLLGYAVLQAQKKFVLSSLTPICTPIASIIIVYFSSKDAGVNALIMGFIIGSFLEFILLNFYLKRLGTSLLPGRIIATPSIKVLLEGSVVLFGGSLIMSLAPMLEQSLATSLGEGKVASLAYAFKLPAMLNGILVTTVGVTVLPFFSEMLAKNDLQRCRDAFQKYSFFLIAFSLILVTFLLFFSEPLIKFLFQRGAFTASDTYVVAQIQRAYIFQLPGALVGMLAIRLLIAQKKFGTVTLISALSVLIMWGCAFLLSNHLDVVGIALGVSISATLSGVLYFAFALSSLSTGKRNIQTFRT